MPRDLLEHTFDLIAGDYSDGSSSDEDRVEVAEAEIMTDPPGRIFIVFGEMFIKYEQQGEGLFSRRICSSEMELSFELSALPNSHVELFTVLPDSVVGEDVVEPLTRRGIEIRGYRSSDGYPLGDVTVFSDSRASIQRAQSAFVNHIHEIRWHEGIIADKAPCWVHAACSSFTWAERTRTAWKTFMQAVADGKQERREEVLVSVELDSENSAAAMSGLWGMIAPFTSSIDLLILTSSEFMDLLRIVEIGENISDDSDGWGQQMRSLIKVVNCTCIVVAYSSGKDSRIAVVHAAHGFSQSKPEEGDRRKCIAKFIHSWARVGTIANSYQFQQLVSGDPKPSGTFKSSRRSMIAGGRKSLRIDA